MALVREDEDDVCDIVSVRIAKEDDGKGGSEEAHRQMAEALDAIFETNRILAEPGAFKETDEARCGDESIGVYSL